MPPRVTAVRPVWAIEGGRIHIEGAEFPVDLPRLPDVHIGGVPARVVQASSPLRGVMRLARQIPLPVIATDPAAGP